MSNDNHEDVKKAVTGNDSTPAGQVHEDVDGTEKSVINEDEVEE